MDFVQRHYTRVRATVRENYARSLPGRASGGREHRGEQEEQDDSMARSQAGVSSSQLEFVGVCTDKQTQLDAFELASEWEPPYFLPPTTFLRFVR
jgi:hypothetical protein